MIDIHRRGVLSLLAGGVPALAAPGAWAQARGTGSDQTTDALRPHFIAEAERMRRQAVAAGDQSYGAIVVKGATIVGWGPSRVVTDRNTNAHAERVAIGDAQARLQTTDLDGAVLFSTSHPCSQCAAAAAGARIARMYWGPTGRDAGTPRRG